ncbi:MAG: DNA mismatch repair endonuclease MutH [Candidatus Berkiellales bacterium]
MTILPPTSVEELLARANALAGKTLGELAATWGEESPATLLHAKGWIGQLIEKALGASAFNLDEPDFIHLGIELKTLPITPQGQPSESTYICTASIPNTDREFKQSRVWRKMAKILWIPIESSPESAIASRLIGTALLWSPSPTITKTLQQDWEELTELITLGRYEELSAHKGKYLQIRPKAANAKTFIRVVDHHGETISTVPKGFYVRPMLTQHIIQEYYRTHAA